ncbi:hypothetical protein HK098_006964 [Nowakowskiella sp. JEL0407]|nr:hypothetical protein HK098_006964 [Nowakowskiella sp. JEL0407]
MQFNWFHSRPFDAAANSDEKHVLILDSSFNPPTVAHQILLLSAYSDPTFNLTFNVIVLLFSSVNADKGFIDDENQRKRTHFMNLLAQSTIQQIGQDNCPAFAIATINQARFLDKARTIQQELFNERTEFKNKPIRLYFIMGFDTIIRVFNQKYYSNMIEELELFFKEYGSRIICADRYSDDQASNGACLIDKLSKDMANRDTADAFKYFQRYILIIENWKLADYGDVSSTKVRRLIGDLQGVGDNDALKSELQRELKTLVPDVIYNHIIDTVEIKSRQF